MDYTDLEGIFQLTWICKCQCELKMPEGTELLPYD